MVAPIANITVLVYHISLHLNIIFHAKVYLLVFW